MTKKDLVNLAAIMRAERLSIVNDNANTRNTSWLLLVYQIADQFIGADADSETFKARAEFFHACGLVL